MQASAEGNGPLIARGEAVGPWETFEIRTNRSDGTISWVSFANHKLVTAENAGESSLIARATEIQDWEKFKFHSLTLDGQRGLAFYAIINNYVMADNNGADPLIARTSWEASYWEQFFHINVAIR